MSQYEKEAPSGEFRDDSYVSRPGHKSESIPVASDQERIEQPTSIRDQDTDEQLGMPCSHRFVLVCLTNSSMFPSRFSDLV
jgi:hypothetical protein